MIDANAMRGLITLPLFLIVLFTLGMGASLLIGRNQPTPPTITRLHLADCALPCWNDITPGVSSLGTAKNRVDATFPDFESSSTTSDNKFLIWTQFGDIDRIVSVVNVTFENGLAATVSIGTDHTSAEMPSLHEVLAAYGAPDCVAYNVVTGYSNWFYENSAHQFMLQFSVAPLALASTVNNLVIGTPNHASCQNTTALSWREFLVYEPWFLAAF